MEIIINYLNHITRVFPQLLQGAGLTIEITALSVFFGTLIGLIVSLGKLSELKILRIPANIYVEVTRGTPLFVQILLFYFGFPGLIMGITKQPFRIEPMVAAVIVCSINSGAYVAEIFRGGIQSIDRGQMEAARSLGMTKGLAMRHVILPQAFKRVMPPLGNEFIALLKDTSILAVIGVQELTRRGQLYVATSFAPFPTYIGVALVYLVLTLSISRVVAYLERRYAVSDRSA